MYGVIIMINAGEKKSIEEPIPFSDLLGIDRTGFDINVGQKKNRHCA